MRRSLTSTVSFAVLGLIMPALSAQAHEMWIEPLEAQIPAQGTIQAHLMIGDDFRGLIQPYNVNTFERLDLTVGDATAPIDGTLGDRPAITLEAETEGLHVIGYQSTVLTTRYRSLESFQRFAEQKGFGSAVESHRERGLAEEGFAEAYVRYAKGLIAAGGGTGTDTNLGMEVEFVALENPYTGDAGDGLDFQLFRFGEPWANQQVKAFSRTGDAPSALTLYETDEDGKVTIPVTAGDHYLLDAVHLREPTEALANQTGAVWETLWASITFTVPAK